MGKDSEIRAMGQAMTKYKKANRAKNQVLGKDMIADSNLFVRHSEHHWSTSVEGKRLDYWPAGSKWRYKNKTTFGTPQDLLNFIKNRTKKGKRNARPS